MNTATTITPAQVLAAINAPKPVKPTAEVVVPPFPLDALPELMADHVRELQRCNAFPVDYTASAFLYAASVCIGNSAHVKVKEGYTMPPVLWLALVGKPGTNKTHPLEYALRPLKNRDADAFDQYRIDMRAWEQEQADRKRGTKDEADKEGGKPRPNWSLHLVTDTTMEALVGKLEHLPRGVGLHCDELAGWWGSMNQYRKGADREKWLSLWNGKQVDAIRKTAGDVLVRRPFVSVCGTVQPGKLYTLGNDQDGFLPRLLFAFPDEQAKPYHVTTSMDPAWSEQYTELLGKLLAIPMATEDGKPVPHMVPLSTHALEAFTAWDKLNTDRTNSTDAEGIASIYPKLECYVHRFALVLEILHALCAEDGSGKVQSIGRAAMEGALKLVEYFEATARKVHFQLFEADAVDRLDDGKRRIYAALPNTFANADGWKIASALGMKDRTFRRWLNDGKLFKRIGHGAYQKLMEG